ncbi:MAG: OmpH family outer membrane protein [Candidatus Gastranaerophilales bacterium]|nr:OmpH family outer membrane protein [Candidatus Gastranaerophilales bacterium]
MKRLLKFAFVSALIFGTAVISSNYALSVVNNGVKIAIVDIQEVAVKYPKVEALQKSQQAKLAELQKFVENANKEIMKEKDATKRKQLETKYTNELETKKKALDADYKKQLATLDNNISTAVSNIAKANKYDYVFAKNAVLYGGENITAEVLKNLK